MKIFYHATAYENLFDILDNGIEARNIEGIVYLCEKPEDAIKFLAIRGVTDIVTLKVRIYKKDYDNIIETFDHNHNFFKCRAFGFKGNIPASNVQPHLRYNLNN